MLIPSEIVGVCSWLELSDDDEVFKGLKSHSGRVHEGIFYIPPPMLSLLWIDGLLYSVNQELRTMLDTAEEEDLNPEQLKVMIKLMKLYEAEYEFTLDLDSVITKIEAENDPYPNKFFASIPAKEYLDLFKQLIEFLEDAVKNNKTVTFSL